MTSIYDAVYHSDMSLDLNIMKTNSVTIQFTINGEKMQLDIPAGTTALDLIRDRLALKGTKEGCGIGECGACTIVVDGRAVNACLMLAAQLDGREVLTVEGLSHSGDLHPIQEAFAEKHAVQCGFCTPGLLMSTSALLKKHPHPNRSEIVKAISGNLCRCTGYHSIMEAVKAAAEKQAAFKKD
jgi:carbon-monoxide dehydrogenase small subunit